MLSPLVIRDALRGGGPALEMMLNKSPARPALANLCGSSVVSGEVSGEQMMQLLPALAKLFAS